MLIRPAGHDDRDAIWEILEPVARAGETFALPRDLTRDDGLDYWFANDHVAFVVVAIEDEANRVLGSYFLQANQRGGGAHVANCGYMTAQHAAGRGIARAMCLHSLDEARARGFRAMQFNFVVSSNGAAVHLWSSLGFATVGRLPSAFLHPTLGYADALVMYREL